MDIFILRIYSVIYDRNSKLWGADAISHFVLLIASHYVSYVLCILSCILFVCSFETGRATVWKVFNILIIIIIRSR